MAIRGTMAREYLIQGTTLKGFNVATTLNGNAASITSATFSVKNAAGVVLRTVSCAIAGGTVTRPDVLDTITRKWPAEILTWDIKYTLGNGVAVNWIEGSIDVETTSQP